MDSCLLFDYRRWRSHRYPQTIYSETRITKIINATHLHPNALALWVENSAYIKEGLNYSGYNKTDKCYLNFKIINFHDIEIVKDIIYNRIKDMSLIIKKVPHSPEYQTSIRIAG